MHCFFIIGAGRSGTSLAASLLQHAADSPVSSYQSRISNPGGFFEDKRVNQINERILARYLPTTCPLELSSYAADIPGPGQFWLARLPVATQIQLQPEEDKQIQAIIGSQGFSIKDPRLSYTLSAWHRCLNKKQRSVVKHICIFRNPSAVVSSVLAELSHAPYLSSLAISVNQIMENWRLQYEWILSKHANIGHWFFVDYESLFEGNTLTALESFSQLRLKSILIDPCLNRSRPNIDIPELQKEMYLRLQSMASSSLELYRRESSLSSDLSVHFSPAIGNYSSRQEASPRNQYLQHELTAIEKHKFLYHKAKENPPLIMTLLCRNEIDIIKAHLDFHFSLGVQALIVTDNASQDGTYELLKDYCQHHPIRLIREPQLTHDQGRWVTRMAEIAFEIYGPCWLIHGDADEFWLPISGDLKTYFSCLSSETKAIKVPRFNMLAPTLQDAQMDIPFYAKQLIREVVSFNPLGQPLPCKVSHRAMAAVRITDGNHAVFSDGSLVEAQLVSDLEIIHYPTRSLQQIEQKIRDGSDALRRNPSLPVEAGKTWTFLAEWLQRDGSLLSYYQSIAPCESEIRAGLARGIYKKEDRVFQILTRRQAIQSLASDCGSSN